MSNEGGRPRGLPLDEIEDLLPRSAAYRQAARFLFPQPAAIKGRPSTPLHTGHVAICLLAACRTASSGPGMVFMLLHGNLVVSTALWQERLLAARHL